MKLAANNYGKTWGDAKDWGYEEDWESSIPKRNEKKNGRSSGCL